MVNRQVQIPETSFFLFGPRQTGKSTLIQQLSHKSVWGINLLLTNQWAKYSKHPDIFRKEVHQKIQNEKITTVFVDEIQRVPILLNEIQSVIDETKCQFILTGSSARKLKRGGANLLGGRAVQRFLFPFTFQEISDGFDLEETLRFGSLPSLHQKQPAEKIDLLVAYVDTYLREEIQAEGIVRNGGGFSRFLDIAASQFGELVSFSNIGRECQLPTRTVQSYYEILEDTRIGFRLEPWRKSIRKRLAAHPKFYLFDLGVTNSINRHLSEPPDRMLRGRLFEQWIILETFRQVRYQQSESRLFFWRTNTGSEVDLLIEKHGTIRAAIEIKSRKIPGPSDYSGLRSFQDDYPDAPLYLVCEADHEFQEKEVHITPWQIYLRKLDEII